MSKKSRQKQRVWLILGFLFLGYFASQYQPLESTPIQQLFEQQQSNQQVHISAKVIKLLPDDNKGHRHQRFIVQLSHGQTLLIAHNIDLAPRINDLKTGDDVEIFGEYEWNEKGGVIHWPHHDPANKHITGWIRHQGSQYQ